MSKPSTAPNDAPRVKRPSMEPIGIDDWSRPGNAHRTLCITQASWSIYWHLTNLHGVTEPEFERRGCTTVADRQYDVYEAAIPGGRREYWMDVSYWFGRGLLMEPTRLNVPSPGQVTSVAEFLGEPEISNLPFEDEFMEKLREPLGRIRLECVGYASNQMSNNVAHLQYEEAGPVVLTAAVRRHLSDSLPLFHGFRFVKPFLVHQVMHLFHKENIRETEPRPNSGYAIPTPGVECVQFTPLPGNGPSEDFWNYMLWAHRPGAFGRTHERQILAEAAWTGIATGYFTPAELSSGLERLGLSGEDREGLREAAREWEG